VQRDAIDRSRAPAPFAIILIAGPHDCSEQVLQHRFYLVSRGNVERVGNRCRAMMDRYCLVRDAAAATRIEQMMRCGRGLFGRETKRWLSVSDEKNSLAAMLIEAVLHPAAKILTEQGA
jgi:hypothetical protein